MALCDAGYFGPAPDLQAHFDQAYASSGPLQKRTKLHVPSLLSRFAVLLDSMKKIIQILDDFGFSSIFGNIGAS